MEHQDIDYVEPKTVKKEEPKTFDYRTHYKDEKTGAIIKTAHYRMRCTKEGRLIERPIKSGKWYNEVDELVKGGREAIGK